MSILKIVIDPGTSATKVTYRLGSGSCHFFAMSPHCAPVPPDYPQSASWGIGSTHLESSWVSLPDACFLIGAIAKKFQGSELRNHELKCDKALYKILGILAHLQLQMTQVVPIDLGILLPFDEYLTKDLLERRLLAAQDSIQFCGQALSLHFNEIRIFPEGAGLLLCGLPKTLSKKCSRISALIIGHRNVSWLATHNGSPLPEASTTNNLGFRWLVQEVSKLTGHTDELSLAELLFHGTQLRPDLQQAIHQCLPLYWQQIHSFLIEQQPTDFVVCGGGAAMLLEPQLIQHFSRNIGWGNHLLRPLLKSTFLNPVLARRLLDSYGLLQHL
ncbi:MULTISPECIES: ParM/StbA family protein [Cyanophyceae]|uniref:ParM/StbA family protein n=1 Tax=Cyanophyceae TaxID=3028117 RepID=UPI00016DCCF0|nr:MULTISPECIES: ParM/StbA family protein [Cyanophyceae]ACB01036.1 conserved hypothetical protein [Picosynechococcus sp. PCC 7002]SMQ86376.1 hypothetical protein SAMN06272774_3116 [Synechococcus sp. 7002]